MSNLPDNFSYATFDRAMGRGDEPDTDLDCLRPLLDRLQVLIGQLDHYRAISDDVEEALGRAIPALEDIHADLLTAAENAHERAFEGGPF